jgi:HAD superfamily hydrolase (TIGR01509 family)
MKAIIFDLGNVLLPIDLDLTYQAFSAFSTYDATTIGQKIQQEGLWVPYESGKQTDQEFREHIRFHLDLNCTDAEFDEAFSALLLSFHTGVYEWILSLKSRFSLYLLSNTSSIHAKRFTQVTLGPSGENLFGLFDQVYFSFDMGLVKPDTAIYEQVIREQNLQVQEVLFFDDNVANIKSAKGLGIASYLIDPAKDYSQIQEILDSYVS